MKYQPRWRQSTTRGQMELSLTEGYLASCLIPPITNGDFRVRITQGKKDIVTADLLDDGSVRFNGNIECLDQYSKTMVAADGLNQNYLGRLQSITAAVFEGKVVRL